ncbi:NAD-binding protein [Hysterangium stoloniferum]|nr:NAD-binding protein [Hysterangium stoloniferum]
MTSIISSVLAKYCPNNALSHSAFPPAPTFNPARDIPDLSGKVVLVTGGNAGIGYCTVRELLLKNAKVYIAGRSPLKTSTAVAKLKDETGNEAIVLDLDLGDLKSVKRAAIEYLSKEDKLDILFNNAGVMVPPVELLTTQGYDLREWHTSLHILNDGINSVRFSIEFGTNVLGHYYLTMLLLPALRKSTAINGAKARVVNTSSHGHVYAPGDGIDWTVLKSGPSRDETIRKWGPSWIPGQGATWALYGVSKMGNVLFTRILNRYHGADVAAFTLHPGPIRSELQRHGSAMIQYLADAVSFPTPMGALTQLWAGTMPEAAEIAVDAYLVPWARIGKADERATQQLQDDLKVYLEDQIRDFETLSS